MVAGGNGAGLRLARRLRGLREHEWPDVTLTQAELALALGAQSKVAPATISSWESLTNPKTPGTARLNAYARFFATRRSLEPTPHLIAEDELDEAERERFVQLEEELLALHARPDEEQPRRTLLDFEDHTPIVIVYPEAPEDARGPLADESNINHTRLHRSADSDALLEVFGHIRAMNPTRRVPHRLPFEVDQPELQNHVVLIGGIAWNRTMRRILSELNRKLPIEQIEDARLTSGEVFRVKKTEQREEKTYFPVTEEVDGAVELIEDVGLLARLPNPFNVSRTVTICNGIHSRGVLGAVYAITDETVRPTNEEYLARRFPGNEFAMLVRVPVVSNKVLAPDLQNPNIRLFEWPPPESAGE